MSGLAICGKHSSAACQWCLLQNRQSKFPDKIWELVSDNLAQRSNTSPTAVADIIKAKQAPALEPPMIGQTLPDFSDVQLVAKRWPHRAD